MDTSKKRNDFLPLLAEGTHGKYNGLLGICLSAYFFSFELPVADASRSFFFDNKEWSRFISIASRSAYSSSSLFAETFKWISEQALL
jgi:hypothetical protein